MDCVKCSYSNPEGCKFCVSCGAELLLLCGGCDKYIPAASKYCISCGQPVSGRAQHKKPNYSGDLSSFSGENDVSEVVNEKLQDVRSSQSVLTFAVIVIVVLAATFSLVNLYSPFKNYISAFIDGDMVRGALKDGIKVDPAPFVDFKNKNYTIVSRADLAVPYISSMLEGARVNDYNKISSALYGLEKIDPPARGNRALARALNDEGLAALKVNNIDDAIDKFTSGVEADQGDQELINNLGFALLKGSQYDQAVHVLINTLALAPKRSAAWANLGYAYAKVGKEDDSVSAYLLTYRFSQDQKKTKKFLRTQLEKDEDEKVRSASYRALVMIMKSEISPEI